MGVPNWLSNLVVAFLTDRDLILRYKGKSSDRKRLPGGSPQGTRLGMFLFLILINFAGFETDENVTAQLRLQITIPQQEACHFIYLICMTILLLFQSCCC